MKDEQLFKSTALEALFRQAVIDSFDQKLDALEEKSQKDNYVFSEQHERRMKKLFANNRRKESLRTTAIWTRRVAAVFAIVFIVVSMLLFTVPDVRAAVGNAVVQFFDKFAKFESSETVSMEMYWQLSEVPEGYTEVSNTAENGFTSILYVKDDNKTIVFEALPSDGSLGVNNEGVTYGQVVIDGILYHTFVADVGDQGSTVIWNKDGYRLCINAKLPIEELLKIARSVTVKK